MLSCQWQLFMFWINFKKICVISALFRKKVYWPGRISDTFVVVNFAVVDVLVSGAVFFGVAVVAAIIFGVDFGVAVVVGSGIFVDSGDIVAFAVVVDDDISKEWLPLLLVSAAYLHLCSLSKSIRYCRHFFVSFL